MNLSYRPHVPLAGLMLVGALGTLAVRAGRLQARLDTQHGPLGCWRRSHCSR